MGEGIQTKINFPRIKRENKEERKDEKKQREGDDEGEENESKMKYKLIKQIKNNKNQLFLPISSDCWNNKFVKLPCSFHNRDSKGNQKWPRINVALTKISMKGDKIIINDIIEAFTILDNKESDPYPLLNSKLYKNSRKIEHIKGLLNYLEENENDLIIIPLIAKFALLINELFPLPIPLLLTQMDTSMTLSSLQVVSLLSCAFFCLFPHRNIVYTNSEYNFFPKINFTWLLSIHSDGLSSNELRKVKFRFLFNYFRRSGEELDLESKYITFHRKVLLKEMKITQKFIESEKNKVKSDFFDLKLPKIELVHDELIEDNNQNLAKVNFANCYIGGGVLRKGSVQEEILFLMYPELIVGCLFTERLKDNEALSVKGVERYNSYKGYSYELEYDGNYKDLSKSDEYNRLESEIICMDAYHFSEKDYFKQFEANFILRELNKAIISFHPSLYCNLNNSDGIISGKWGCGAFGGDSVLKFIIQIIACSIVQRESIKLTTFHDQTIIYKFQPLLDYFKSNEDDINIILLIEKLISFNEFLIANELNKLSPPSNDPFFIGEILIQFIIGNELIF
ncbi:hypothetical protein K502DRAFT_341372 [Neoconidiobolus thromboides FSU 785]|nr:hypothetical protein K502DRAFT_341372 [Neoconidiobolus thromboides FSU 785]